MKTIEPYVDAKAVAEYLGLSKVHIYKLTSQKKIPHYKLSGGIVRFKLSELDEFVKSCKVDKVAK